jgi:hypothetical protein
MTLNSFKQTFMEDTILSNILNLYEKYKSHPYMVQRFFHHVNTVLPVTLENELNNHEKRIERICQISSDQETFMHLFFSKNALFYLFNNNTYFLYNGDNYSSVTEDNLNHLILSTITKEGGEYLNQWKYKTKITLIRQIKQRPLWKSIPESQTIQKILSFLTPTFFNTKEEAKYFLTIVGDNLLKKYSEEEGLYFLAISDKIKVKKMLMEIDSLVFCFTGINNVTSNIVTKYHPTYNFDNCRILHFVNDSFEALKMKPWVIDFLCVCAYHSERYQNSENFILTCASESFLKKTLYMKNKTSKMIRDEFCDEYIIPSENSSVSWKNLHYIWKLFIAEKNIPNIFYAHTLKETLKEKYTYNELLDSFENITSKWLPLIRNFLSFWENTIQVDLNSELEIEEIAILFKMYCSSNAASTINEEEILKILNHYFITHVDVVDKKYVLNISCSLWDKNNEIINILQHYKEHILKKKLKPSFITFDSIYSFYTKQKPLHSSKMHISKRYFEKFMDEHLEEHIVIEKCIHCNWLNN